jgi:hypothetical protein
MAWTKGPTTEWVPGSTCRCSKDILMYRGGEVSVVDKLRELKLSKDDRVLYKHGLIYESGKLTEEGKAAVLQQAFDLVKADLVENLRAIDAEDKKKK